MIQHTESFNPIAAGRVNVSTFLSRQAKLQPYKKAIVIPSGFDRKRGARYCSSTFLQLEELVNSYSWALNSAGIDFGMRVLVAQQPGRELVAITFALYRIGAVPVFIDPGMGKEGILNCVTKSRSSALIGNVKAHILSYLKKKAFSGVEIFISTSKRGFGRVQSLYQLPTSTEPYPVAETRVDDMAAILFTSGSTGPAKGVVYTHGMFTQQIQIIQEQYKVTDDDVDMSIFPLFALFAICMGMKTVIPDMDTSKPMKADPERICRVINDQCVSFSFGSPTFWNKMADYCIETKTKLPTLRALLMAGCSVPATLHSKFLEQLFVAEGDTYIPYGAT